MIEAVAFEAGRHQPGLALYLDISARLNTLYELRHYLDNAAEDNAPKYFCKTIGTFRFVSSNPYEIADKLAFRQYIHQKMMVVDDHIFTVRDWLARLDSKNTIDHRPEWSSEFRRYQWQWPVQRLMEFVGMGRERVVPDRWSQALAKVTLNCRKSEYVARLDVELARAWRERWYVVFDTLTIDPQLEEEFLADETAMRDHVRRLGRAVNMAMGRKAGESFEDVFRFFAVPEYGKAKGRLHFHCLYMMRELPKGCVDPNMGRRVRNRREIQMLKNWPYGFSTPIAVRYSGDAFSDRGWLWPVDKEGKPLEAKPVSAIAKYVTKYITKAFEERRRWLRTNNSETLTKRKRFRIRMTRKFGMIADLSMLSLPALLELSCLHYSVNKSAMLWIRSAKRMLSLKMGKISIGSFLEQRPNPKQLLEQLRDLTRTIPRSKLRSFTDLKVLRLRRMDISNELSGWIDRNSLPSNRIPVSAK